MELNETNYTRPILVRESPCEKTRILQVQKEWLDQEIESAFEKTVYGILASIILLCLGYIVATVFVYWVQPRYDVNEFSQGQQYFGSGVDL